MLNEFTWNMTGYIPKYQVNPHGDGIIPYVAERIFQLELYVAYSVCFVRKEVAIFFVLPAPL